MEKEIQLNDTELTGKTLLEFSGMDIEDLDRVVLISKNKTSVEVMIEHGDKN